MENDIAEIIKDLEESLKMTSNQVEKKQEVKVNLIRKRKKEKKKRKKKTQRESVLN